MPAVSAKGMTVERMGNAYAVMRSSFSQWLSLFTHDWLWYNVALFEKMGTAMKRRKEEAVVCPPTRFFK
jgi:hypothetical protein